MAYIYGLIDPITNELKYIGYTELEDLSKKRNNHWKERNHKIRNYKRNWLKGLYENYGLKPEIIIIEEIEPEQWKEAETFWIEYYNFVGCKLSNIALGGRGRIKGTKVSEKQKRRTSRTLRRMMKEGSWTPIGGVKGSIPWNKGRKMKYSPKGGKLAKGVDRPWQDGVARSGHRKKEYIFIDPMGNVHKVNGLQSFCRENTLHPGNMTQLANGKYKSVKGWTIPEDKVNEL